MKKINKKSYKNMHGITIIALAITIVIIFLLVGLSISMVVGREGILNQTKDISNIAERKEIIEDAHLDVLIILKNEGKITKDKFKEVLDKYFTYKLEGENLPDDLSSLVLTTKDKKYNDILVSEIYDGDLSGITKNQITKIKEARKLVENNTSITSDDGVRITIPAGFTIPEESPNNAKEGIIITDSINESTGESNGNEFVWIPVKSDLKVVGTEKVMAKVSTNEGYKGTNGKVNYEGVLYDFTETESTEMSSPYGQGTIQCREPDALFHYDGSEEHLTHMQNILKEEANKYANKDTFKATIQEDYNEMINSVTKYGGFYVARYEMGIENDKAISKAGIATNNGIWVPPSHQWFGLYAYAKTFTNTKNSVKSSMIWGSQYDAMLNYALTGNDKDKVTAIGNGHHGENAINTGKTPTDKILNIFDLGGNYGEWTLEAHSDNSRILRGGCFNNNYSPNFRNYGCTSDGTDGTRSTRLTLYIQ